MRFTSLQIFNMYISVDTFIPISFLLLSDFATIEPLVSYGACLGIKFCSTDAPKILHVRGGVVIPEDKGNKKLELQLC